MQTIHEAAAAIRAKQITPVDLVEQCLKNIDLWEEHVRAWVFVDRDGALAEARRLTDELSRGQYRGVAGCKPAFARVSCNGVVPLTHSMDHPGPIARCTKDLALLLQAMLDPYVQACREDVLHDFAHATQLEGRTSICRLRGFFE